MRFPLRLSATLYSQKFQRGHTTTPILCLSPLVNHFGRVLRHEQVTTEMEWHTPEGCVAAANRANARIVWLGDAEPLLHPHIGRVVAALLQAGRHVFLHTSGLGLRKRIHEFQPDSGLFLTIEIPNDHSANRLGLTSAKALQLFHEAIDGAGLSGFYRCAHLTVDAQTDVAEAARWFDSLKAKGVEGVVLSSNSSPASATDPAILNKLAEIRDVIPSRGWRYFSRILEESRRPLEHPRVAAVGHTNREALPPSHTMREENA
jgi:hypothetical protein